MTKNIYMNIITFVINHAHQELIILKIIIIYVKILLAIIIIIFIKMIVLDILKKGSL